MAEASTADVARVARVSLGTVSRVFNDYPQVDPTLRRRVHVVSRQLGFIPKSQPWSIALIMGRRRPSALSVGYVSVLTSLLVHELAARRYSMQLIDIENLDLLYETHAQGAIGVVFDERLLEVRKVPKLPLLTLNNPLTQHGIHSVRTDHYQQGRLATEHLIGRGQRAIGILTTRLDEWGARERHRGYVDAMAAAGLVVDPAWVQQTQRQATYDVVTRLRRNGVTALLNFGEDAALEVLHVLTNVLNCQIGRDVSVISVEDLPIYRYLAPPQTTVSQPLAQLARLAVETMLELCADRDADHPVVDVTLPCELIDRDSVADLNARNN